jgi:cell division septum initiation protein DivIVA
VSADDDIMGTSTMTETSDTAASEEYYPEFRTVRRGYDPDQVEQVLDDLYASLTDAVRDAEQQAVALRSAERTQEELKEALADAERRIGELERHPAESTTPSFENLGSRIAEILQAATAEAAEITRKAREDAQAIHNESEASAVTSRAEVDHYATDIRTQADNEAQEVTARARAEAARILDDARILRETQQRADLEAYERLAAELAERRNRAEVEFANEAAAHQRRLAALTARVDVVADELSQERRTARAQADAMIEEASRHRAKARAQIRAAREQLHAVMSSAGLPVPLPRVDRTDAGVDAETDSAISRPAGAQQQAPQQRPSSSMPWVRPAPAEAAAWSSEPADTDSLESGVRR